MADLWPNAKRNETNEQLPTLQRQNRGRHRLLHRLRQPGQSRDAAGQVDELATLVAIRIADRLAEDRDRPEQWVGVSEAARHLGCDTRRIYDLCSKAGLPHTKDGARSLFRLSELDGWLERRNVV